MRHAWRATPPVPGPRRVPSRSAPGPPRPPGERLGSQALRPRSPMAGVLLSAFLKRYVEDAAKGYGKLERALLVWESPVPGPEEPSLDTRTGVPPASGTAGEPIVYEVRK